MPKYNEYNSKTNLSDGDMLLVLDNDEPNGETKNITFGRLRALLGVDTSNLMEYVKVVNTSSEVTGLHVGQMFILTGEPGIKTSSGTMPLIKGTKVNQVTSQSTATQIPSAKAVYDAIIANAANFISGTKVTTIQNAATDNQIPTAKAVRDRITSDIGSKMDLIQKKNISDNIPVGQLFKMDGWSGSNNPVLKYRNNGSLFKENNLVIPILIDDTNSDSASINNKYKVYSKKDIDDRFDNDLPTYPIPYSTNPRLDLMIDGQLFVYQDVVGIKLSGNGGNYSLPITRTNEMILIPTANSSSEIAQIPVGQVYYGQGNYWIKKSENESIGLITGNKSTSINSSSNNNQIPTAKAVYDFVTQQITAALQNS